MLVTLLAVICLGNAQPWFPQKGEAFNDDVLPRVDITINADSLDWLYENIYEDHEFKVRFVYTTNTDSDTINDVGFRLRGNTSRQSDKKSFKVSFNTFKSGRKYNGLEKMNLNGEHNDPSIIRSYLAWNIFEQNLVPGSRSNHVELYINNQYYGLYINVEHIDEEFVESRFGNKLGNLYKCIYPADLSYLGNNKYDYKDNGYSLKTNTDKDDFSDLINLAEELENSTPENMHNNIEPIFNINGFIRYLVVEVFTGHWDAFTFGKNNFYLYNNHYTGKFEFLPYDLDNTFGIDWFIDDLANRNIYAYWPDWEERALTSKVMANQVYRDRFSFLLNKMIEEYINEDILFPKIDSTFNKINDAASRDTYRTLDYGWDYNDFVKSYTEALGDHVRYGLKEYITKRLASIKDQIEINPIAPIIENVYHNFPQLTQSIKIKTDVTDDDASPVVKLNYNMGNTWQSVSMVSSNDLCFTAILDGINQPAQVKYYIEATDASGNVTREPYSGEYVIRIGQGNSSLVINEFMAGNQGAVLDNFGESDDWIEIYNNGTEAVNLKGKYLSDDLTDRTKWNLPNVVMQPGEYYIVWADNDTEQGENHANFKLSASGESIGLFDSFENSYAVIDTLSYGEQIPDVSMGVKGETIDIQNLITPLAANEGADYSYLTIAYNMNKQIADGKFERSMDYIDILASFNNYEGSFNIYDGNGDGIHEATIMGLQAGENIEFRARMNSEHVEYGSMDAGSNRLLTLEIGENRASYWFDDVISDNENVSINQTLNVYPNPVNGAIFNISSVHEIVNITMFTATGKMVLNNNGELSKNIVIENSFNKGVYFIKVNTEAGQFIEKLVVN